MVQPDQQQKTNGEHGYIRPHLPRKKSRPGTARSDRALPQPNLTPDLGPEFKSNAKSVLDFIRAHKSYTPPGYEKPVPGEHPKFDDAEKYGISDDQEDRLWVIETNRLIRAVSDLNKPLRFESPVPSWGINKAEFENLAELGNQALHCLNICRHDNQLLMFDHYRDLFEPEAYLKARNILSNAFDPDESTAKPGQPLRGREHPADLNIHDKTAEVFCAFVDYATAAVARLALRGIPSEFWHVRALAGLAKTSAKMKLLFTDLEKFARQSLEEGQDILAKDEAFTAIGGTGGPALDIVDPEGRPFQMSKSKDPTGREDVTDSADIHRLLTREQRGVNTYFSDMAMIGTWTAHSLRAVFFWFQRSAISGYAVDTFDICGLVYKSGLNGLSTLVYQDRDGELVGSSNREVIRLSYSGFKMLHQVVQVLVKEHSSRPPITTAEVKPGATLNLDFLEVTSQTSTAIGDSKTSDSYRLELTTMGDYASVFVPLAVATPLQLGNLIWATEIVTSISSVTHTIDYSSLPSQEFTVYASLRTSAYENTVRPKLDASDARSLSQCLVAQNRLRHGNQRESTNTKDWESLPTTDRQNRTDDSDKRLRDLHTLFKSWDIQENSIVVKRQSYVILLLLGCAILVIGGVMVGVFMGEKLTGVDPFNITLFAWILAGFLILVFKSLLVSEWPWRDFLKGRVPCRSVTELHDVTQVETQDILEYLLSREFWTILVVKGPYHRPFVRKSDGGDGFSIDVKISLRTLLASGILVVKVAGPQGLGLVCMDLRKGARGRNKILHADKIEKEEYGDVLGSFDIQDGFDEVPLTTIGTSWTKILGIYHRADRQFR
ncbi:hypothetical protein P154DRAFT_562514 [Amniculicola lignicola CBS 123094]|uniref:Uncharacterized protein n=1 Tax=Amniculicola lignicola CBS 123094 TaxID=1392246 RepID=A0A6A5WV57_9PLEO|nr:hypothetical protein P154DRAFT_562514 [Amniculicola lignicola CBS 123094]